MLKRLTCVVIVMVVSLCLVWRSDVPVVAEQANSEPIEAISETIADDMVAIREETPGVDTSAFVQIPISGELTPVSINYSKIDLDIGTFFTLTATTYPVGQTVTWSSSSSNVTVDGNGCVTAVSTGIAVITATIPDGSSASCTVYATLADGIYNINNASSGYPLSTVGVSSPGTNVYMFYPMSADSYYRVYQIWDISYVDDGRYVMRLFADPSYALAMDDTGNVCIQEVSSSNMLESIPTNALWTVVRYGSSDNFWLMNNGYGGTILAGDDGATTAGTNASVATFSSSIEYRWTVEKAWGIFLRETETLHSIPFNSVFTVEYGTSSVLADMGMTIKRGGETTYFAWSSSDTSVVRVNTETGAITAVGRGEATITVNATIHGVAYRQQYKVISVISVDLMVYYDLAYADVYGSGAETRTAGYISDLVDYFYNEFYLLITPSRPLEYVSLGDVCSAAYDEPCTCGTCEDSYFDENGTLVERTYHHKNIYNMLVDMPESSSRTDCNILFTRIDVCFNDTLFHYVNSDYPSTGAAIWGLSVTVRGNGIISDTRSAELEKRTTLHEFGHLFGAPDHYGENGVPTTDAVREQFKNYGFDENCLYGENKDTMGTITICDGCRRFILDYLNFLVEERS